MIGNEGVEVPHEIVVMCTELRSASVALKDAFRRANSSHETGFPERQVTALYEVSTRFRPYQRRLLAEGTALARTASAVVLDHNDCLISVLERGSGPLWSHLSLARAAIESALRACDLLDPRCDLPTRVARVAATLIDSGQEQVSLASQFGDPHLPDAKRYLNQSLTRIERAGFELDRYRGRVQKIRFKGYDSWRNVKADVTGLARTWIPDTKSTYTLGSGATHGSIWMTIQNYEEGASGEGTFRPQKDSLGAAAMAVVDSVFAICMAVEELYERPTEDLYNDRGWSLARIVDTLRP